MQSARPLVSLKPLDAQGGSRYTIPIMNKKPQTVNCYSASEAARELGVSPTMIYTWLDDGTLKELTTFKGRMRLVDADSVFALRMQRAKEGKS